MHACIMLYYMHACIMLYYMHACIMLYYMHACIMLYYMHVCIGICDGAASLIVASEQAVSTHKLTPLTRLIAWHRVGCDPKIMGIG